MPRSKLTSLLPSPTTLTIDTFGPLDLPPLIMVLLLLPMLLLLLLVLLLLIMLLQPMMLLLILMPCNYMVKFPKSVL